MDKTSFMGQTKNNCVITNHETKIHINNLGRGGGALEYFLGGYVLPGTPNWHPVLKKISPKIDTQF